MVFMVKRLAGGRLVSVNRRVPAAVRLMTMHTIEEVVIPLAPRPLVITARTVWISDGRPVPHCLLPRGLAASGAPETPSSL